MTFATFFKQKRIALRLTLRAFCQQYNLEPSYISRIERGRVIAPKDEETLEKLTTYLQLNEVDKCEFIR